jgi:hypothetical protein
MGSTKLRRLFKSESKWTDKNCDRHKHNFCVRSIVEIEHLGKGNNQGNRIYYYEVMKCEQCNSFVCVPHDGAIDGFISDFNNEYKDLPKLRFRTNRGYLGIQKDMDFVDVNDH